MFLEGIQVIDFTSLLPGPYATLRLVDLGAEVIKIEQPDGGDPARHASPLVDGTGAVYLANNRNKRSVVLDLKTEEGRARALSLMEDADVVIEGYRPGVMRRLGLDYEAVRDRNETIVYCSLTGFGQTGPMSHLAGHEINYLAASGVLSQFRDGTGHPILPTVQLGDMIGGMAGSEAILAALLARFRTGEGAYLDISITDALTGTLTGHLVVHQATGFRNGIHELNGTLVCYHLYETKDGRTVSVGALEPKFWRAFCEAVGQTDWISHQYRKTTSGEPVYDAICHLFQSRTLAEWTQFGRQVDCCLQPVLYVDEVCKGGHATAREVVLQTNSSGRGTLHQFNTHAGGMKEPKQQ